MPADGEFKYTTIIGKEVKSEYQRIRGNPCVGSAFINCLFSTAFTSAGSFMYFHDGIKALRMGGMVGSLVMLVTGMVCIKLGKNAA